MSQMIVCEKCGVHVPADKYLAHLKIVHKSDVMKLMKSRKDWRGLCLMFLVFSIGVILGMTFMGLIS